MLFHNEHPLSRGQFQLRLFQILPEASDEHIHCSMGTFELDVAPEYSALSYEWGPRSEPYEVIINDHPCTIRANLWAFLSKLRAQGRTEHIWCDALCIDQDDLDERSHQVQLMSQIYSNAASVLVWLGEEGANSDFALGTIRLISDPDKEDAVVSSLQSHDYPIVWEALLELSNRSYWTRIWIVQEIIVAKSITVHCGDEHVEWTELVNACTFPPDPSVRWGSKLWSARQDSGYNQIKYLIARQLTKSTMIGLAHSNRAWPRTPASIQTLLDRYKDSGCEDKRDKIFALLDIARETVSGTKYVVDYRKDFRETFFSLIAWSSGALPVYNRIKFARMAADALDLSFFTNAKASEIDRLLLDNSPHIARNFSRPMSITIPVRAFGQYGFKPGENGLFIKQFEKDRHVTLDKYEIFGIESSNVVLACKSTRSLHDGDLNRWTVVTRAEYRGGSNQWLRLSSSQTMFQGLYVVKDTRGHYVVTLRTLKEFMEVAFHKLDTTFWSSYDQSD